MSQSAVAGETLLAEAMDARRRGDWAAARQLFGDVLAKDPDQPDALHVLGVLDYQDGNLERARERVEAAVRARPDTPDMLNNLGTIYLGLKRMADSLRVYARAVELQPGNDAFCSNLAVALNQTGQHEQAVSLSEKILSRSPEHPGALNVLGNALRLMGRLDEAEAAFRRLVARAPGDADSHYNLGVVLQDKWQLEEALGCYDHALAIKDNQARFFVNRGAALLKLHRVQEAAASYERAVALDPTLAEAHYNLAICRFLTGNLAEGAAHYEWRLKVEEGTLSSPRKIDKPVWDGSPALDKVVLLHSEQGLGDMVQFVRFVRAVHVMVKQVVLEVQRPLKRLFMDSFPGLTVVAKGEEPPAFDFHAPLMSLMHKLKLELDDLPASPVPYLKAQPERVRQWAEKLGNAPGRKVAIAWQGNPKAKVDRGRSMQLAMLEPLLRIPGLRFISLQKNDGAEQMGALPPELRAKIEILGETFDAGPDGFLDTVAVMENCDLVLTTDTSIDHIAGGLGRPTWVMLKKTPDWRWMLNRADSPWYPSMRLFRQTEEGNWARVVADIAEALQASDENALTRALVAHQAGKLDEAEAAYRNVLEVLPENTVALHHLGVVAYQRGQMDVAETRIREALALEPDNADILANLSLVLKADGRLDEAMVACHRVLSLAPQHYAAHNNLANILRSLGRTEEALPHYDAAIRHNPNSAGLYHNKGLALHDLCRLEEAKDPLEQAVKLAPDNADFHFDLARTLLMSGDWVRGWKEYEWRRRMGEFGAVAEPDLPRWTGALQPDKVLLVHAEQGLGDTFQFLRFVALARAKVGHVVLVVPPQLKKLAATVSGVDAVYGYGEALPFCHLQIPLLSLPAVLGTTVETLPKAAPYLKADAVRMKRWKEWRGQYYGLMVGLAWQGNTKARSDAGRSLHLTQLQELFSLPGMNFVALQKGEAAEQVRQMPKGLSLHLPPEPFDEGPNGFADTAALMEQCDLVVTTDTSIAHLAGALGRPTFVMLKHVPDWRWMLERADSPWYPGMRLFRQKAPGDWGSVVSTLKSVLLDKTSGAASGFQQAVAAHQRGKLEEASRLYEATIETEPQHLLARLYLGVVRYQQGRPVEAEKILSGVVSLRPDLSEAWGNLALALKAQQKLEEAKEAFAEALRCNPDNADAHNNLGNLLTAEKRFEEALGHYDAAIRLLPGRADSYQNKANTLGDMERYDEAIENYRRAIALRPRYLSALNGLGKAYRMKEQLDEAAAAFREAIEADPNGVDAWSNLGVVWREKGNTAEALRCYDEALKRQPGHAETWGNRALALHYANRLPEAEAAYREAVQLKPEMADSQFGLGAVLLTQGKMAEGWKQYEWRRQLKDSGPLRQFSQPQWQGEIAPGKTLFLFTEQGLGDTLQFIRFVEKARARVGKVVVEVQPQLYRLLSTHLPESELLRRGEALPAFDIQCPLMSLPGVLGTVLENLPSRPAYLSADPDLFLKWKAKLKPDGKTKLIGLNWQGNPKASVDKGRSIPLKLLAPLLERDDCRFIVLQKNDGLEQMEQLPLHLRSKLELLVDYFDAGKDAFVDSAAVMANLDVMITTDTAMAHLAGALGVPTYVLLKFMPDWRWMTGRSDTPWYPGMKLFRQTEAGEWEAVVKAVNAALPA